MFKKILIANRGEIALRIIRACREMGIATVAVHSTADATSMAVRLADESVCIGPPAAKNSYLNIPAILTAAAITGADAIHPGYGFLSENAQFARMVEEHGFVFIGPKPEHIEMMGDKVVAKQTVKALGLPVVPGSDGAINSVEEGIAFAKNAGYPVLIKAASGGGGKGMKVVRSEDQFKEAFSTARAEAKANFGDDTVYLEKYLETPRHIEIQIFGDTHGNGIHLGERDCSTQRRHQKLVEEAPSPALDDEAREKIGSLAAKVIREMGYRGAGTIEFLYENGQFFFMEMNTRIQVEHPVTEMITGIDLIAEQIRVAAGEPLSVTKKNFKLRGHAIEGAHQRGRPRQFRAQPRHDHAVPCARRPRRALRLGDLWRLHHPALLRLDGRQTDRARRNREEAIRRLRRAINETVIVGVKTTLPRHQWILEQPEFLSGAYDIHWLEKKLAAQ